MELRVLIAAEHASAKFGGEAALALHYYRVLRQRNIPTWLVVHERTRSELETLFPDDEQIVFVADTVMHRLMWRLGGGLPAGIASFTTGFLTRVLTQFVQRRLIRQIVNAHGISVVHQPMPVSPKEPSMIYNVGAPVIIGPMNGGIDYPPAFKKMQGPVEHILLTGGRSLSNLLNWFMPGKRKAAMLLVANTRTYDALPHGVCDRVETLVENGVDVSLWKATSQDIQRLPSSTTRFVFVGRLVDWKAVDLLLLAFKQASPHALMSLSIIGDDIERGRLEQLARELDLLGTEDGGQPEVYFHGWLAQADCAEQLRKSDVLVLPSLRECGGAVVLEAMAMELPVIATNWGGPADYLDASCGILVDPVSRESFIDNLSAALIRLAKFPQERIKMGKAGKTKVIQQFNWEVKVDNMLGLYQSVADNVSSSQSSKI